MEVELKPETEAKLDRLASETGRSTSDFVEAALDGYLEELISTREMLDRRYEEIRSGKVESIPAEDVFRRLQERSDALRSQS